MCFTGYFFLIKICWDCFCFLFNPITRNDRIVNKICKIFTIFTTKCSRIPNIIFLTYMMFLTVALTFTIILILIWISLSSIKFAFTFAWYMFCCYFWFIISLIHFVNIFNFDILIPLIISKTFIFKSSVLFGTHNLWEHYSFKHIYLNYTTNW